MKKIDFIAAFIIGEISAWIAIPILNFIELELPIIGSYPLVLLVLLPALAILAVGIAHILAKKIPVILQIVKFFLVGISNSFVDFGVLNFLMWITAVFSGWLFSLFLGLSFSLSVINSYFWNKYWTFEKKETKPGPKEFSKFYIIAGVGFLLNIIIASFIVNVIGPQFGFNEKIWANIGKGIAIFCICTWNFLGYKFIVFKK
ncbi:GtrA family protein [Patescibacteria group bacterium]